MYLALPPQDHTGAVLVLHSWWGLNAFFRGVADRFAQAGYVSLAADLYGGRVARTAADARRLRASIGTSRKEPAYRYLIRMIDELRAAAGVDEIAVVGCSMGAHWAYWLAQRSDLPIRATVSFYATRGGDYGASRSAFLVHLAERDEWVSPASVRRLTRQLAMAGLPLECHTYAGTGHWFFEADRPEAYHADAAALAWARTLEFLQRHLAAPKHPSRASRRRARGDHATCRIVVDA